MRRIGLRGRVWGRCLSDVFMDVIGNEIMFAIAMA